jgi:hypothetical protein
LGFAIIMKFLTKCFGAFEQYKGFLQSLPGLGSFFTLLSEVPQHSGSNVFNVEKDFYFYIAFWAIVFYMTSTVLIIFAEMDFFPQMFQQAKQSTRGAERIRWLQAYVASILHHLLVISLSVVYIYRDWSLTDRQRATVDYTAEHWRVVAIPLGYFFQDFFVYAIPKGDIIYMIHHGAVIALITFSFRDYKDTPGYLFKYAPYTALTEISSVFFCIAWILRTFDVKQGQKFCELAFGICFFFFRILCLPLSITSFLWSNDKPKPFINLSLYTILGLQFYWMVGIIQSALRKLKND